MRYFITIVFVMCLAFAEKTPPDTQWIRINLLGYAPNGSKVAVWCSKDNITIDKFELVDKFSNTVVQRFQAGKPFGAYGPFVQTYRLDFSSFKKPGQYMLRAGSSTSPEFRIGDDVYAGTAEFCLRYMRQQRTGFNPFLNDSCHTKDGYVLYGTKAGIPDSTYIDVVGGWHDASDYLQYTTTSANATYHLLAAYRDFPKVFGDKHIANGTSSGGNGVPDVLDEAKWGLDWLLKMHPKPEWMFNQIADDRDHMGMRIPKMDSFYGKGFQRPVYFNSGEPQQRGKLMNKTTGTSSTAAKFSSAFNLGAQVFSNRSSYAELLKLKALSALAFAMEKPGVTQTASVRAPYIYAEENWVDDMELAMAMFAYNYPEEKSEWISRGVEYAEKEPLTPWLGKDTASHYQWYPFINAGHYELATQASGNEQKKLIGFYKTGIEAVYAKARNNAFLRGVPFIWCSNNLTTSFAIQCYWYRQLTNDATFLQLEQANFDWLFGCNPWGTSMVYGLPSWGDTPVDPHSAFTHLKNYPIDGGLVDGPVYGSIFNGLIGIRLKDADEYAEFQSDVAVYHDDYGDYSTNEPTMDGTASLIYLLAAKDNEVSRKSGKKNFTWAHGGIIRGDSTEKKIALVFTGHEYAEGADFITQALAKEKIKASFFLTGRFYENPSFEKNIQSLKAGLHYLGPHSYDHVLCCDWKDRNSLLVNRFTFGYDLAQNRLAMKKHGIENPKEKQYYLPAFEWYNDSISKWSLDNDHKLINYTPGTLSHADYTLPFDQNYRTSDEIYNSIVNFEKKSPSGLNGFILLMHLGAGPGRTDKFYLQLPKLLKYLKSKGYQFQRVDDLLMVD